MGADLGLRVGEGDQRLDAALLQSRAPDRNKRQRQDHTRKTVDRVSHMLQRMTQHATALRQKEATERVNN